MRVKATRDLGRLVRGIRLTNHLRQTDLATEACVGRQWILALEQGKPSLEIGMVLRTLDALGLTLDIVAPERPPQWVRLRAADAEMIQAHHQPAPQTPRRAPRRGPGREAGRGRGGAAGLSGHDDHLRRSRRVPDRAARPRQGLDRGHARRDRDQSRRRSFLKCLPGLRVMLRVVTPLDDPTLVITAYFDRTKPCA